MPLPFCFLRILFGEYVIGKRNQVFQPADNLNAEGVTFRNITGCQVIQFCCERTKLCEPDRCGGSGYFMGDAANRRNVLLCPLRLFALITQQGQTVTSWPKLLDKTLAHSGKPLA